MKEYVASVSGFYGPNRLQTEVDEFGFSAFRILLFKSLSLVQTM